MSSDRPILYSFRRCPYAMRARMALQVTNTQCRLREVVLRNKPEAMLAASPKGTVPVLVLSDGTVIDESLDVMKWALAQSDPDGWISLDAHVRTTTNQLIEQFDTDFKHHLDRYKYPNRYDNVVGDEHRAAASVLLFDLNETLANSPYLTGETIRLADIALMPFIRQFANTDRAWFDQQGWPHLLRWLNTLLDSDVFNAVMKKYPVWSDGETEPIFPEA